jgi:nitrite reductase/ring-hydroxylating ferredoxin subunit
VDLDYGVGDFYDGELDRIVCKNHGALFHPQTGFCEWGPCTGHSLERFEIETEGMTSWWRFRASQSARARCPRCARRL